MKRVNQIVYRKPVDEVITKIEAASDRSILLMGLPGSGKTTVLNELKSQNKNLIDGSVIEDECLFIYDLQVYRLYHVCLIAKKILLHLNNNYRNFFDMQCFPLLADIEIIIAQIRNMCTIGNYNNKHDLIVNAFLENPKLLLNQLSLLLTNISCEFKLMIDNFDSTCESNSLYQKVLYDILRDYISLILTVSDESVLCNETKISQLSSEFEIVKVDYSSDLNTVKEILNMELQKNSGNSKKIYVIDFIVSDIDLEKLISMVNGNLFYLKNAINALIKQIDNYRKEQYFWYLVDYINDELSYIDVTRKLHI